MSPKKPFRVCNLHPNEIRSQGTEKLVGILKGADINLLGIHTNTIMENLNSLRTYLESADGCNQMLLLLAINSYIHQ